MRRYSVLGLLTVVILMIALASPVVYGQVISPTATTTAGGAPGAGSALPGPVTTSSPDSAPGGTGLGTGTGSDSAPGQVVTPISATEATVRRASDLSGSWVRSVDDRRIGRIDNFLVSPSSGDVQFALVATGGFFGFSEKLVAVPMSAFFYDPAADEFILIMDARTFEQAPSMSRYSEIATSGLGSDGQINSFWSSEMGGSDAGTGTGADIGSTGTLTPTVSGATTGTETPTSSSTDTGTGMGTGTGASATATPAASTGTDTGTGIGSSGVLYTVTPIVTLALGISVASTPMPTGTPLASTDTVTGTMMTSTPMSTATTGAGADVGSTGTLTDTTGAGVGSTETMTPTVSGATTGTTETGVAFDTTGLVQVGSEGATSFTTGDLIRITELGGFSMLSCPASAGVSTDTGTGAGIGGTDAGVGSTGTMTDTTGAGASLAAGSALGTVEDALIDLGSARIVYLVINVDGSDLNFGDTDTGAGVGSTDTMTPTVGGATTGAGSTTGATDMSATEEVGRLILVPRSALTADAAAATLCFSLPASTLEGAPSMTGFEVPDTTLSGWDKDINSFWDAQFGSSLGGAETGGTGVGSTGTVTGTETMTGTATGATGTTGVTGRNLLTRSGTIMQYSQMRGMTVRDTSGQDVGRVDNLLVASDTGAVLYGVLTYGGGLFGLGAKQTAIPWAAFTFDSTNEGLTVPFDRTALDAAPNLSSLGGVSAINQPGWDDAVQQYWQQHGLTSGAGTGSPGAGTGTGTSSTGTGTGTGVGATGATTSTTDTGTSVGTTGVMTPTVGGITTPGTNAGAVGTTMVGAQLLSANSILGMRVRGSDQDQTLGAISDLLINTDAAQVVYAFVSYGGFLGMGQTTKPLPFEAMQYSSGDNTFVVNITSDELGNAPDLSLGDLPETVDPNWDANVRTFWQTRTSR